MIRRFGFLLLLVFLPQVAIAAPVQVTSGDHPDFTRLVVQFSGPVDWQMGRTADGYELRIPDKAAKYNLSKVFDLIGKNRLAAIWADPDTGALHFGVGCACFAMPFEFRPGTVVIDIRNGPPPKGSSFELPLDGGEVAQLEPPPVARPKLRPDDGGPAPTYDWTLLRPDPLRDRSALASSQLGFGSAGPDEATLGLEPLRQSLIEQLSRGASAGVVDMAKPKGQPAGMEGEGNPSVEIRLGEAPNLVVRQKGEGDAPLTAEGMECIPNEKLDVASWAVSEPAALEGEVAPAETAQAEPAASKTPAEAAVSGASIVPEMPVSMQIAIAMSGLTGEFDRPDAEALKRAVRFDLYIGFGAEARALMRAFPTEQEDAAIWQSMARIIDEEPDPNPVFAGMAACDTSAALWAILADPETIAVGQVEKAAILRAFSALPVHLRRQLGPALVDRFLTTKDLITAIALRDSVLRGTGDPGPEVELMQAAIDRASGSPGASVARLENLASQSGPTSADTMAALISERAELGQDVSYDQVTAMEEYAKERTGSEDSLKFNKALVLAYGASGDFEKAFANLDAAPQAAATLWQILGNAGPDSAVLTYATLAVGQEPPNSAKGAASLVANRMLKLGLGDQAARWLQIADSPPQLLVARVAVAQGDPHTALQLLATQDSPAAIPVRLEALDQIGDEKASAEMYASLGMAEERSSALSRMQDWAGLAATGPDVWKAAIATISDAPTPDQVAASALLGAENPAGPLAKGEQLIARSAATRDAISALLNAVKSPAPVTP